MNYNDTMFDIILSWLEEDKGINSLRDILFWVNERNKNLKVEIDKISLKDDKFWYYDKNDGKIRNRNKTFFSLSFTQMN